MKVSFDGIGEKAVTFAASGTIRAGDAVYIYDNGVVKACANNAKFAGIAMTNASDGLVTVKTAGYITEKYSGTAPSVGFCHLVADGNHGVKKDSGTTTTVTAGSGTHDVTEFTGGEYLIAEVDTTAKLIGFFM